MTRKPTDNGMEEKQFNKSVMAAYQKTSPQERRDAVLSWSMKDFESYVELANERGLEPMALIIAAMLDVEHPAICEGGLIKARTLIGCSVLVLQEELRAKVVPTPCGQLEVVPNSTRQKIDLTVKV